jgi:hypothetical protein
MTPRWRWRANTAAICLAIAGGCAEVEPGRSRDLGVVDYDSAYAVSRSVFAEHFTIAEEDPSVGLIRSRPVLSRVEDPVLGSSARRRKATLRLRRDGQRIIARVAVAVEKLASTRFQRDAMERESYSRVPNLSPAETDGPEVGSRDEAWVTADYDRAAERRILAQIDARLVAQIDAPPAEVESPPAD